MTDLAKHVQLATDKCDYERTHSFLLAYIDKEGESEEVLNSLISLQVKFKKSRLAAKFLLALCCLIPENKNYVNKLLSLCHQENYWLEAVELFSTKVAGNSADGNNYFNLAYYQKLAGLYSQAIDNYQTAIEKKAGNIEEIYLNLAVLFGDHLQDYNNAKSCLVSALEHKENYVPALFNLAGIFEEQGDKIDAEKLYKKIINIDGNHSLAIARLLFLSSENDDISELIKQAKNLAQSNYSYVDEKIVLYYSLGKVYDQLKKYELAFHYYQLANNQEKLINQSYCEKEQELLVDQNIEHFSEQWLNKLSEGSFSAPIFICGMFRSGSTLIEQILAAHPEITAGGENEFFSQKVKSLLSPYPLSLNNIELNDIEKWRGEYQEKIKLMFPNAKLITDKRPDNIHYLGLIKTVFPNAKIVFTTRDIRDNSLSLYFQQLSKEFNYANDINQIIHHSQQQKRLMTHWKKLFPKDIIEVSYDELVDSPKPSIAKLLNFLKLDWHNDCLEFHQVQNNVKTVSLWQVRQPLYKASSGRWKNYKEKYK